MIKELIDLQRNSSATCAVILSEDLTKLKPSLCMRASVSDKFLFGENKPSFSDKLNQKALKYDLCYFIIADIDNEVTSSQNRFVGMVKDRYINGYTLPKNVIIVFTVNDRESLKNISKELYHFAVVAI